MLLVLFFTAPIRLWVESPRGTLTLENERDAEATDIRDGESTEVVVGAAGALWDGTSLMVTVLTGLDIVTGSCKWTELH